LKPLPDYYHPELDEGEKYGWGTFAEEWERMNTPEFEEEQKQWSRYAVTFTAILAVVVCILKYYNLIPPNAPV